MNYQFEICANSIDSCRAAQAGGADRVELCDAIPEGGTTPSYGKIILAREVLNSTRLHVIIRPRRGDFLYSETELRIMEKDIEVARQLGADGVVFGCLTPQGDVDINAMKRLLQKSAGLSVTFHRAFDVCRNPKAVMEQLIALGCHRILSSGQEATAEKGIALLKELQQQAVGRIALMAGCGVSEQNISRIAGETGVQEFHFSARETQLSRMQYRNEQVSMGGTVKINEFEYPVSTENRIKATIAALKTGTNTQE